MAVGVGVRGWQCDVISNIRGCQGNLVKQIECWHAGILPFVQGVRHLYLILSINLDSWLGDLIFDQQQRVAIFVSR